MKSILLLLILFSASAGAKRLNSCEDAYDYFIMENWFSFMLKPMNSAQLVSDCKEEIAISPNNSQNKITLALLFFISGKSKTFEGLKILKDLENKGDEDAKAITNLLKMVHYISQSDSSLSEKKAYALFHAAKEGNLYALNGLAMLLPYPEAKEIFKSDFPSLFKLLEDHANKGNAFLQAELALYYYREKKQVLQAIRWALKGVQGGSPYARGLISNLLTQLEIYPNRFSNESKKELSKIFTLAKSGNVYAQKLLSHHYSDEFLVDNNESKKYIFWLKKAAENGDTDSQRSLALLYFRGAGVEKDSEKAIYWMEKVVKTGSESDKNILDRWVRDTTE